jgi:hypothetical protein
MRRLPLPVEVSWDATLENPSAAADVVTATPELTKRESNRKLHKDDDDDGAVVPPSYRTKEGKTREQEK